MDKNTELNRAVSEAMGKPWRKPTHGTCCTCQTCGQYYDDGCLCDWTDDSEKSVLLEDEIERRGLQKRYMDALASTTNAMPFDNVLYPWSLIRATPEQRARAFLEAIAHDQS
jgi:hypothetical protein